MRTLEPFDEMNFEEFRDLLLDAPIGLGIPMEFMQLLRAGCSEAEAKRWLAAHIWEIPQPLRDKIVMAFAADALHRGAREAPPLASWEEEAQREFIRIWTNEGFRAANLWYLRRRASPRGRS